MDKNLLDKIYEMIRMVKIVPHKRVLVGSIG